MNLYATTDELELISSAAVDLSVVAAYTDLLFAASGGTQKAVPYGQRTAFTAAETKNIVDAPAASTTVRRIDEITVRNKSVTTATTVTIQINQNATIFEIIKIDIPAGATLEYKDGVGWYLLEDLPATEVLKQLSGDVTNATTSFADITGLTFAVEANKKYLLEANIIMTTSATTTGFGLSVNGPASPVQVAGVAWTFGTISANTAGYYGGYVIDGYDVGSTTLGATTASPTKWPAVARVLFENGSTAGTLAVRFKAETAATVTAKSGSFATLREIA